MTGREAKLPIFLAWRQIRRGNPWTLVLIIFLIAVAFINLVFVSSLFKGIIKGTDQQIIDTSTGDLVMIPKTDQGTFDNPDGLLTKILSNQYVAAASAHADIPARISLGERSGTWNVVIIDPTVDQQVLNISERIEDGSYLQASDEQGILLGRQIVGGEGVEMDAFSLRGANVGDQVRVSALGANTALTVRGIVSTKFLDTDQKAFITRQAAIKANPALANTVTSIIIRLNDKADGEQAVESLRQMSGSVANIYTWQDAAGLMRSVSSSFTSIDVILSFVAVLIAAITIFIVIYLDISGRKREIGILRAIGIKPSIIQWAYVLQTLFYTFIGVIVGSVLFFGAIVPYFAVHPFALPIVDASLSFEAADLTIRIESIFVVAVLSGLIPTIHFTRIKLLDAIWGGK